MKPLRQNFLVLILLTSVVAACAQRTAAQTDPSLLTLDTIFSYRGQPLNALKWEPDGKSYLVLEPSGKGEAQDIVRYDAATGQKTIVAAADKLVPPGSATPLVIEEFEISPDARKALLFTNTERVWRSNTRGDYWVFDLAGGKLQKLGGDATASSLMFAKFSPDSSRVGYVRGNNIYVESLADGKITQLTTDGTFHLINGTFDWVYEEELFCRDGWRWSPDGKRIAYWQLNSEGVKEFKLINDTAELYPVITTFPYPKAGETNSAARVGVISASGGATTWFEVAGDPRNNYLPRMEWATNSDEVTIQQLNRLQNTDTVMIGDARTGKVRTVLVEKDNAWLDIGFFDVDWDKHGLSRGDVEWIDGGKRFLWASERNGWHHVYSIARDGSDARDLTPGDFDVISFNTTDAARGVIYFDASPENATQRYLFRARLDGKGKPERVTPVNQAGTNNYIISPAADLAIHSYSTFGQPAVSEVVRLPQHEVVRTLIDNRALRERLAKLKQGPREFFRVDVGDGVQLDGWMIKPPDFDPKKRYPVLFYVYGEPAAQTVLDEWGGGTYMWHLMLSQQGYIVMSVDNRGTPAPRGRAWRKSIYRKIGIVSSQDQANAVRAVDKWPFVDSSRIAIWGWSGGGSSTLNAMFRYADVYSAGMSVAPVPDIRYYDSIYQERYCALPKDHPDEYKQSSPVTFASQLKGQLLVVHGSGDDNVHYQGTEELINALVAANKQFTMMVYPNRSHGIYEGAGTRRHLFGLLTRFLEEKVPAGGRSE
ncbi:MAG TPA: S9 family peptidase [Pyrinomonadaceae bacterium]|nr:S9 family peptidase [Pyrinomonadaceae bacterium]